MYDRCSFYTTTDIPMTALAALQHGTNRSYQLHVSPLDGALYPRNYHHRTSPFIDHEWLIIFSHSFFNLCVRPWVILKKENVLQRHYNSRHL